jgi:hypothetical protein
MQSVRTPLASVAYVSPDEGIAFLALKTVYILISLYMLSCCYERQRIKKAR